MFGIHPLGYKFESYQRRKPPYVVYIVCLFSSRLSARLFVCLPFCLPVCLAACMPAWLPICLACLSCLPACMPKGCACLLVCLLPACLIVSLCLSRLPDFCLSVCLNNRLTVISKLPSICLQQSVIGNRNQVAISNRKLGVLFDTVRNR
jgi:hypothetical protein